MYGLFGLYHLYCAYSSLWHTLSQGTQHHIQGQFAVRAVQGDVGQIEILTPYPASSNTTFMVGKGPQS